MSAFTNYAENKLIDHIYRGQPLSLPANWYVALMTTLPSDASAGTEVTGGAYARVALPRDMDTWAGTQGPGTTTVSTGASGTTSNNAVFTFPAPTDSWGTVVGLALFDQAVGGNMWSFGALGSPKNITAGADAPSFPISALQAQIDD